MEKRDEEDLGTCTCGHRVECDALEEEWNHRSVFHDEYCDCRKPVCKQ